MEDYETVRVPSFFLFLAQVEGAVPEADQHCRTCAARHQAPYEKKGKKKEQYPHSHIINHNQENTQ